MSIAGLPLVSAKPDAARHATSARQARWVSLGISRALFAAPGLPPHSHSEVIRNLLHPGHGSVGPAPCGLWYQ